MRVVHIEEGSTLASIGQVQALKLVVTTGVVTTVVYGVEAAVGGVVAVGAVVAVGDGVSVGGSGVGGSVGTSVVGAGAVSVGVAVSSVMTMNVADGVADFKGVLVGTFGTLSSFPAWI